MFTVSLAMKHRDFIGKVLVSVKLQLLKFSKVITTPESFHKWSALKLLDLVPWPFQACAFCKLEHRRLQKCNENYLGTIQILLPGVGG